MYSKIFSNFIVKASSLRLDINSFCSPPEVIFAVGRETADLSLPVYGSPKGIPRNM